MMRRQLLLLLVAMSLMLVLALPAAVQARQSWEVRDRAGHVRGKAVTTGTRTADIVKSGGVVVGDVWYVSSADQSGAPPLWVLRWYFPNGVDYWALTITPVRSGKCWLYGAGTSNKTGLAVRTSHRWILSKRVNGAWKRVGSAPLSCPGQYALGAARRLLW